MTKLDRLSDCELHSVALATLLYSILPCYPRLHRNQLQTLRSQTRTLRYSFGKNHATQKGSKTKRNPKHISVITGDFCPKSGSRNCSRIQQQVSKAGSSELSLVSSYVASMRKRLTCGNQISCRSVNKILSYTSACSMRCHGYMQCRHVTCDLLCFVHCFCIFMRLAICVAMRMDVWIAVFVATFIATCIVQCHVPLLATFRSSILMNSCRCQQFC